MSETNQVYQAYQANTYLFGGNAPYVEEMYENYLANPGSVDAQRVRGPGAAGEAREAREQSGGGNESESSPRGGGAAVAVEGCGRWRPRSAGCWRRSP